MYEDLQDQLLSSQHRLDRTPRSRHHATFVPSLRFSCHNVLRAIQEFVPVWVVTSFVFAQYVALANCYRLEFFFAMHQ